MDIWRTVVVHVIFCFDQDLCMTLLQGFKYFNYVPHSVGGAYCFCAVSVGSEVSHNRFLCDNLKMPWPIHFKFDVWITHGPRKVPFINGHRVVPPGATIWKQFPCDNSRMPWPIHFKFDVWITHGQRKVPSKNGHQVVLPGATIWKQFLCDNSRMP